MKTKIELQDETVALIERISIDENGILKIRPKDLIFDKIYRSAMGVQWDEKAQCLFHNPPDKWSSFQWFKQILRAVKSEYGITLLATDETTLENVDNDTVVAIKKHMKFIIGGDNYDV